MSAAPTSSAGPIVPLTVSEVLEVHRAVTKLKLKLAESDRCASFWKAEFAASQQRLLSLEAESMLQRAENTRWQMYWSDYASTLYRIRVAFGNGALSAQQAQYAKSFSRWKQEEHTMSNALHSAKTANDQLRTDNIHLTKEIAKADDFLKLNETELAKLRAAVEGGACDSHLESEIRARDDLIEHMRLANKDLSLQLNNAGGGTSISDQASFISQRIDSTSPQWRSAMHLLGGTTTVSSPTLRMGNPSGSKVADTRNLQQPRDWKLMSKMASGGSSPRSFHESRDSLVRAHAMPSQLRRSVEPGLSTTARQSEGRSSGGGSRKVPVHLLGDEELDRFLQRELMGS